MNYTKLLLVAFFIPLLLSCQKQTTLPTEDKDGKTVKKKLQDPELAMDYEAIEKIQPLEKSMRYARDDTFTSLRLSKYALS